MKIEILKGCIFILIGAYLCARFMPEPSPEIKYIKQEVEVKSGKVIKRTQLKPDGTHQIDEVHEYLSNRQSNVSVSQKPAAKKNMVALIPKYNFKTGSSDIAAAYSYNGLGIYGSKSEIGLVFNLIW